MSDTTQLVFPTDLIDLLVPVEQLVHYPGNARIHDLDRIEASLRSHGQYVPVVVQRSTNYVLKGNGTLEAARDRLHWKQIAAVFKDVDDDQARAINLMDNLSSDMATMDRAKELALVEASRKAKTDRLAMQLAGQTEMTMADMDDGYTEDDYETLKAEAGLVDAESIEQFVGTYQQNPERANGEVQPSERKVAEAIVAGRAAGMKEIVLILTTPQYDAWVAKIKECQSVWGCKSGSEAAVQLIARAPHFGAEPKGLDGHGPGYD